MASLTYDSSEARTGTGRITSNIRVSTRYESTLFPETHQETFGNMGINIFKKGTRQKAHVEQQQQKKKKKKNV